MVMPSTLSGLPDNPPNQAVLTQDKFDRGVITLIDQSKLPRNALKEGVNIKLAEDGAPMVRDGIDWYGTAADPAHEIEGAEMYAASDGSIHLIKVVNGIVYRSTNDGLNWSTCTGGAFTPGKDVGFLQANTYMYIFNGWDNIVRYSGSTTLSVYTALSSPTPVSLTKTGLAGTAYTYRYRVSAVNDIGYTQASTALTIQTDRTRATFDGSNRTTFTWNAVVGAIRYDIYVGQTAGEEVYLDSVDASALTYIDQGQSVEQITGEVPEQNTTQGPRVGDMAMVGTRIYATRDRDFSNRVWISAAGKYIGYFSSAYDATYIDLPTRDNPTKPVKVVDYRDGKGTPLATVWCDSPDGLGCIWQGTLESFTVGDVTFPVPNFYKLPGSRGTSAPGSVVNVLNDYMYFNLQAFYNLGSRAQFLNLLSTDEASANIRPNILNIKTSAASGIASHFQNAKVYMSVPYNSELNNYTIVFDTERKAWLPQAFDKGFKRFFNYTDQYGDIRLLCWKPGDSRLSEISPDIRGDYGQPITTSLITGLRHVNERNRFDFMWIDNAEVEFANSRGTLMIELSGITREDGYRRLGDPMYIRPSRVKRSWTTGKWTTHKWTDVESAVVSYSEPSLKRFFGVNEDINAYQYRVSTNTLDAQYILRTLQVVGTASDGGLPPDWELFTE